MKRKATKETAVRAFRTFVQASLAYIAANIVLIDWSDNEMLKTAVIGVIVSALSAGISAMMNLESIEIKNSESEE